MSTKREEKKILINDVESVVSKAIEARIARGVLENKELFTHVFSESFVREVFRNCLLKETGNEDNANVVMAILENSICKGNVMKDIDVCLTPENIDLYLLKNIMGLTMV